jgi:hypothetical protein
LGAIRSRRGDTGHAVRHVYQPEEPASASIVIALCRQGDQDTLAVHLGPELDGPAATGAVFDIALAARGAAQAQEYDGEIPAIASDATRF